MLQIVAVRRDCLRPQSGHEHVYRPTRQRDNFMYDLDSASLGRFERDVVDEVVEVQPIDWKEDRADQSQSSYNTKNTYH